MMKTIRWLIMAAVLVAANLLCPVRAHAGLFKLDFSAIQNSVPLTNWDTFADWSFTDFPDGIATWKLTDFSTDNNTNVTLTIADNAPLAAQLGVPPAIGVVGYSPDPQGLDVVYDGINVPAAVKDDYFFRNPDTAGTELLFRFANLAPGQYHVTVFDGRTDDPNGQYGKIWIDDLNGTNEPPAQNTGDFSANPLSNPNDPNSPRVPNPWGHPQTLVVNIKTGDFLWYAHLEDSWGGIAGMIIRSWVDSDGDGMPDDWEIKWGLNPHDPSDTAQDLNGNGISNLLEYQCGLDPADPTRPTIRSVVANSLADEVVVTFSKPIFAGSGIPNDPRDATIATNLANYSISPALAITGVAVEGNVVTLTTAKPTPGVTAYTLTVNNVRDVNNWPVAPNTSVTFSLGAASASAQPQIYRWFTIAGVAGYTGSTDATNRLIRFHAPSGVALDRDGNLYVGDARNTTIRKLTPVGTNWVSSTIAGKAGNPGSADGTNSAARFGLAPAGDYCFGPLAVTGDGTVFVADYINHTIRKVTPIGTNWVTTTIGGVAGQPGPNDGTNSDARFYLPNSAAVDKAGNVYVTDGNNTIRKLTPDGTNWVTTTIAGLAGHIGTADGTNSAARFNFKSGLETAIVDSGGIIYVTDCDNHTIRKLTPVGTNWVSSTIAGKAGSSGSTDGTIGTARFNEPTGVAADSAGNVYISENFGITVRKLMPIGTNWVTATIGGRAMTGGASDGTNSAARFLEPMGMVADSHGNLYLADFGNNTIRKALPLPVFQSVTPVNGRLELFVNAAPGQTVQLQYSSDLASATWTNLGSPITATSGTISATDTLGPDQRRFYRVIVQP